MTAAAQITNPAQESCRAVPGKPEIHQQVMAALEGAAPGCSPVFGAVTENDQKFVHSYAFKGAFTVSFAGAERRFVIVEAPLHGRCVWFCYVYVTARTRKPKRVQAFTDFAVMAEHLGYDLREDMRRTAATSGALELKPDDVLYASWGYDQTNIDFYKVLKVSASGESATIVPIGQRMTANGSQMGGTTVPLIDRIEGEPVTRRKYDRNTLHGYRSGRALLHKWDGQPCVFTSYA